MNSIRKLQTPRSKFDLLELVRKHIFKFKLPMQKLETDVCYGVKCSDIQIKWMFQAMWECLVFCTKDFCVCLVQVQIAKSSYTARIMVIPPPSQPWWDNFWANRKIRNWGISFCVTRGYGLDCHGSIPVRDKRSFLYSTVSKWTLGLNKQLIQWTLEAIEAWSSPLTSIYGRGQEWWRFTSMSAHVLMLRCLIG